MRRTIVVAALTMVLSGPNLAFASFFDVWTEVSIDTPAPAPAPGVSPVSFTARPPGASAGEVVSLTFARMDNGAASLQPMTITGGASAGSTEATWNITAQNVNGLNSFTIDSFFDVFLEIMGTPDGRGTVVATQDNTNTEPSSFFDVWLEIELPNGEHKVLQIHCETNPVQPILLDPDSGVEPTVAPYNWFGFNSVIQPISSTGPATPISGVDESKPVATVTMKITPEPGSGLLLLLSGTLLLRRRRVI